jgi:predicted TIM-barrel fold metal-dependent hydrolase
MTDAFTPAIDAHVHLLPERLLRSIQRALNEEAGWQFSHPVDGDEIEQVLEAAGVERYFVLPYAHKPNMADDLNEWVLDWAEDSASVPFATVHGDDDVERVVGRAFENGARGLKFQCPVQECGPADSRLDPAFELAAEYDRPIVFHAGTAPMYENSPHVGADQFEQFLASYPDVRASCAHMGTFEYKPFIDLVREHDNAFLDTCFAMSSAVGEYMDFDPAEIPDNVFEECSESIMYGSDFPNIPYAYQAERENLLMRDLSNEVYDDLFRETAKRFLGESD